MVSGEGAADADAAAAAADADADAVSGVRGGDDVVVVATRTDTTSSFASHTGSLSVCLSLCRRWSMVSGEGEGDGVVAVIADTLVAVTTLLGRTSPPDSPVALLVACFLLLAVTHFTYIHDIVTDLSLIAMKRVLMLEQLKQCDELHPLSNTRCTRCCGEASCAPWSQGKHFARSVVRQRCW